MHSDPVADMLTRLRNGCGARLARVAIPYSKLKLRIAEVLAAEGFIQGVRVMGSEGSPERVIEVNLRYDEQRRPVIGGIRRFSSPGLRRYFGHDAIPKVRNGLGMIILTTSQGLLTDSQARQSQVGGEALCSVW